MDRILLLALLSVLKFCFFVTSGTLYSDRRKIRFKRLIYGTDLTSHNDLNTQYMVSLKKVHACENALHFEQAPSCDSYAPMCGGALIAPDFVITACHCIVNEHYSVRGVKLPPFHPAFERWTTSTTDNPNAEVEEVEQIYVRMQPLHPIYNLLSLWMGSVEIENMPQRQFAKALIPHSACTIREIHVLARSSWEEEYLWGIKPPQFDIGLVRAWNRFQLNKDVRLVPMKFGDDMLDFHQSIIKKMSVCLFTGFGETESDDNSKFLRYTFRHQLCTTSCMEKAAEVSECEICSTSIARPDKGIRVTKTGHGDSGSPLVCDDGRTKTLFGVLSAEETPKDVKQVNATNAIFSSIVCVRDFVTAKHLTYLRQVVDDSSKGIKLDAAPMGPYGRL